MKFSAKKTLTSLGIAAILTTGTVGTAQASVHIPSNQTASSAASSTEGSTTAVFTPTLENYSGGQIGNTTSTSTTSDQQTYASYTGAPITNKSGVNVDEYTKNLTNTKQKALVQSALSQLGDTQDCTMLVTNALKSIGINHHSWPDGYLSLGKQVSQKDAQPGSLIVWESNGTNIMMGNGKVQQHVAIVVKNDNGKITAVHGGWNGDSTALWGTDIPGASKPIFVSVA